MPYRGRTIGPDNIFQSSHSQSAVLAEVVNAQTPGDGSSRLTDPTTFANEHTNNPQLHIPGQDATMVYRGQFVTFANNEPILIEPALFTAAVAAGITFTL